MCKRFIETVHLYTYLLTPGQYRCISCKVAGARDFIRWLSLSISLLTMSLSFISLVHTQTLYTDTPHTHSLSLSMCTNLDISLQCVLCFLIIMLMLIASVVVTMVAKVTRIAIACVYVKCLIMCMREHNLGLKTSWADQLRR